MGLVLIIATAISFVGFLGAGFDLWTWKYQQKCIQRRQQKYTKFTMEPYRHEDD